MIKFPLLKKSHKFELSYGLYYIHFLGGFSLDNLDLLKIHLFNIETQNTTTLNEKYIKSRDIIDGQKAIACYEFQITDFGRYKLDISNPEIIEMKNSYNNPLSIFQLFSSSRSVTAENINIVIK